MTELQQRILEIVAANNKSINLSDLVITLKQDGMGLTATQVRAAAEETGRFNFRTLNGQCRISLKSETQDAPRRGRPPKTELPKHKEHKQRMEFQFIADAPEESKQSKPKQTKKGPEMTEATQAEPQQTQADEAFAEFLEQESPIKPQPVQINIAKASEPKPITPQFFVGSTGLVVIEDGHKVTHLSKSAAKQLYQALHKQFAA